MFARVFFTSSQAVRLCLLRLKGFALHLVYFVVAVRLRCFASGRDIARVASSAPSLLFVFACSTTFPSCGIDSLDILIGSNYGELDRCKGN
ncbi:hypothetical protein IEQ34_011606 [Dendrobium chrysotoxum]|uniref:Secreted protein n=1 Tax=Dendrobium chrysotoxum TaxID=161865 RepID=A0AAV7GTB7_DENCH|nr:hypothetical protein IEQ34_011606 [Dendrobium chrysotoxum]